MVSINGLEITQVVIHYTAESVARETRVVAVAKVVFNEMLAIADIRIVLGKFGPFVKYPHFYDSKTKKSKSPAFPMTKKLSDYMTGKILREWQATND